MTYCPPHKKDVRFSQKRNENRRLGQRLPQFEELEEDEDESGQLGLDSDGQKPSSGAILGSCPLFCLDCSRYPVEVLPVYSRLSSEGPSLQG